MPLVQLIIVLVVTGVLPDASGMECFFTKYGDVSGFQNFERRIDSKLFCEKLVNRGKKIEGKLLT